MSRYVHEAYKTCLDKETTAADTESAANRSPMAMNESGKALPGVTSMQSSGEQKAVTDTKTAAFESKTTSPELTCAPSDTW